MTVLERVSSSAGRLLRRAIEKGRLHPSDRAYYGGRRVTLDEISETFYRFNRLPPRLTEFCDRCGSEVRWYRENRAFDVSDGKPTYTYHLKCPRLGDMEWERSQLSEWEKDHPRRAEIIVTHSGMHYNSHLYAHVHDERDSFANDELP